MSTTHRILSHQACTGGTVITRLIATSANLVVLSELSPLGQASGEPFQPLAPLIQFAGYYPKLVPAGLLRRRFLEDVDLIDEICRTKKKVLVIRDHAHSEFMIRRVGGKGLEAELSANADVRSVVTVRHPVASFTSLTKSFPTETPESFVAYCARYLAYLDDKADWPVHKYEDFCLSPMETARSILTDLDVPKRVAAGMDLAKLSSVRRTGNSGRNAASARIKPVPLRKLDLRALNKAYRPVEEYQALCERLGYDPDVEAFGAGLMDEALIADPFAAG